MEDVCGGGWGVISCICVLYSFVCVSHDGVSVCSV